MGFSCNVEFLHFTWLIRRGVSWFSKRETCAREVLFFLIIEAFGSVSEPFNLKYSVLFNKFWWNNFVQKFKSVPILVNSLHKLYVFIWLLYVKLSQKCPLRQKVPETIIQLPADVVRAHNSVQILYRNRTQSVFCCCKNSFSWSVALSVLIKLHSISYII